MPSRHNDNLASVATILTGLILRNVSASISLPARFVVIRANRPLLSVTYGPKLRTGQAERFQEVLGLPGTRITESQVVLFGAALVAETLDGELIVWILLQNVP